MSLIMRRTMKETSRHLKFLEINRIYALAEMALLAVTWGWITVSSFMIQMIHNLLINQVVTKNTKRLIRISLRETKIWTKGPKGISIKSMPAASVPIVESSSLGNALTLTMIPQSTEIMRKYWMQVKFTAIKIGMQGTKDSIRDNRFILRSRYLLLKRNIK